MSIGVFTQKITIPGRKLHVLVAMSSGDLGVDHPDAQLVVNFEFPDDCSTVVQRRGRASRNNEIATFILVFGISAYLAMVRRTNKDLSKQAAASDLDLMDGFNNTEIASPSKASN